MIYPERPLLDQKDGDLTLTLHSAVANGQGNYKLKDSDVSLPEFFTFYFNASDQMLQDFNENDVKLWFNFNLDSTGRMIDIVTRKSAGEEYDSLLFDFLEKCPPLDMSEIDGKYWTGHQFRLSVEDHTYSEHLDFVMAKKKKNYREKKMKGVNWSIIDHYQIETIHRQMVEFIFNKKKDKSHCVMPLGGTITLYEELYEMKGDSELEVFFEEPELDSIWVFITFKDCRAYMSRETNKASHKFIHLPSGLSATAVAISYKGDRPVMSVKEFVTGESELRMPRFKRFSLNDLDEALSFIHY